MNGIATNYGAGFSSGSVNTGGYGFNSGTASAGGGFNFGAAFFAMSALSAINSIYQGRAMKEEAKLNAAIYEGQAIAIDIQKGIEKEQYQRLKGQVMGKSMATMAAQGIMPSGSAMAVLLDTQKQIEIDQAIGQFNLEQSKRFTMAQSDAYKRKAKYVSQDARSTALSQLMGGAFNYGLYSGKIDLTQGAKGGGKV